MDYAEPTSPEVAAERIAKQIKAQAVALEREAHLANEKAKELHNAAYLAECEADRYRQYQPKAVAQNDDRDQVWCVFLGYGLDSVFDTQELAQERADLLTGRGEDGVLIEPYDVRQVALDE